MKALITSAPYFKVICPRGWMGHLVIGDLRGPFVSSLEEAKASLDAAVRFRLVDDVGFQVVWGSICQASLPQGIADARPFVRKASEYYNVDGVVHVRVDFEEMHVTCEAGSETLVRMRIRNLQREPRSADDIRAFVEAGNFVPFSDPDTRIHGRTIVF